MNLLFQINLQCHQMYPVTLLIWSNLAGSKPAIFQLIGTGPHTVGKRTSMLNKMGISCQYTDKLFLLTEKKKTKQVFIPLENFFILCFHFHSIFFFLKI